jgi:tRNA G10  N-methylase Trm11
MSNRLYKDKIPHVKNSCRCGKYLYTTNSSLQERSLCRLEMRCLFGSDPEAKDFYSDVYVDPSRSPFIRHRISVLQTACSLEELKAGIKMSGLKAEKHKVYYINLEGEKLPFKEKRTLEREAGMAVGGTPEMEEPVVIFGITVKDGLFVFGFCESNDYRWQQHKNKPHSYSNSLSVEVSRAIANIAVPEIEGSTLVDPCCGAGTVVMEALDMGIDAVGSDINRSIVSNARENLEHFGFRDAVAAADMLTIEKHFDSAVLDLPYGVFTSVTRGEQLSLIAHTRKLASRAVIVTFEEMAGDIAACGFTIIDACTVSKGRFTRHIYVCS